MTEVIRPFRPNIRQLRLAQTGASLGPEMAPPALCAAAGISERTYYRWREQPGFRAWFAAATVETLADSTPLLLLGAMRAAIQGDNGARRLMFALCVGPEIGQAIAARLTAVPSGAALAPPAALPAPGAATRRRPERQRASVAGRRSPAAAAIRRVQNRAARPVRTAGKPPRAAAGTPPAPKPAAGAAPKPASSATAQPPAPPAPPPPAGNSAAVPNQPPAATAPSQPPAPPAPSPSAPAPAPAAPAQPPAPPAPAPAPPAAPPAPVPQPVTPGVPPAPAAPPMWGYNALGKLVRWR